MSKDLKSAYIKKYIRKLKDNGFIQEETKRLAEVYKLLKTFPDGKLGELNMDDIAPFADYVTKKMLGSEAETRGAFINTVITTEFQRSRKPLPNASAIAGFAAVCVSIAREDPVKGAEYWGRFSKLIFLHNPVFLILFLKFIAIN